MKNKQPEPELEAGLKERELIEAARRQNAHIDTGPLSAVTNSGSSLTDFMTSVDLLPGTMIGPYKLLEKIGEGGFGVVYAGEQKEPIRRKVAIKIIKPGMGTKEVIARFEAERQALTLMDHPNIARVIDAGATQAGNPYFVMELVPGIPLTSYCDRHKLSVQQRLELFILICRAVQHAHQKGIIHRDIKPGNILVENQDNSAVPKVIDFGVAKATNQQLTEHTVHTLRAQMIGTPLYMSPEQADKNAMDVDTRSDIYSLGVLLYEMLTGTTPIDRQRLRTASAAEFIKMICDEETSKPSSQITVSGAAATTIAENRAVEPIRLRRLLRGDLDWIVIKALEKERGRRYQTATDFARDVQRFLNDEPVSASPPSTVYRIGKFARRNKVAVAAASMVLLSLLIATGVSSGMALLAVRSEKRAQDSHLAELETRNKLYAVQEQALATEIEKTQKLDNAFEKSLQILKDAMVDVGRSGLDDMPRMQQLRRDVLEKATVQYEGIISDVNWVGEQRYELMRDYAGLLDSLARIRRWVGADEAAIDAYQKGDDTLALLETQYGPRSQIAVGRATLKYGQGLALRQIGRAAEAETALRQSIEYAKQATEELPKEGNIELCRALNQLGYLLAPTARWKEAESFYREAVEVGGMLSHDSPDDLEVSHEWARAMHNLAIYLQHIQRPRESEEYFQQALTIYRDLFKWEDADSDVKSSLASVASDYAILMDQQKKPDEAEELRKEALSITRVVAADYPYVPRFQKDLATSLGNIGLAEVTRKVRNGKLTSAPEEYRESEEILRSLVSQFPDNTEFRFSLANHLTNVGICYATLGENQTAQGLFEESAKHCQTLGENQPNVARYQARWAENLLYQASCRTRGGYELEQALELTDEAMRHFELEWQLEQDSVAAKRKASVWDLRAKIQGFYLGNEKEAIEASAQAAHYADLAKQGQAVIYQRYCLLLVSPQNESLRNPSKAIELAPRFINDLPNAYSHYILGLAYFRNADFKNSLTSLTTSCELEGESPKPSVYTRLLMAMSYHKLARHEEAREAYDQALKLLKDFDFEAAPQHDGRQLKAFVDEAAEMLSISDEIIKTGAMPDPLEKT